MQWIVRLGSGPFACVPSRNGRVDGDWGCSCTTGRHGPLGFSEPWQRPSSNVSKMLRAPTRTCLGAPWRCNKHHSSGLRPNGMRANACATVLPAIHHVACEQDGGTTHLVRAHCWTGACLRTARRTFVLRVPGAPRQEVPRRQIPASSLKLALLDRRIAGWTHNAKIDDDVGLPHSHSGPGPGPARNIHTL